ncbi:MAG: LemA family protein [Oscillospiraceae bacterium]
MPWIIVAAILFLLLLLFIWAVGTYNALKRCQIKVQEANSGIDVALTKRYDMLTKLFDVAKGYLSQEQKTLLEAIRLRSNMPIEEKQQATQQMDLATREIKLVAEAYPALSSQKVFSDLQHGIMDAEEHLQAARRLYNANVSILNQKVISIPTNIIAGMANVTAAPMFIADAHKHEDVNLKF